MEINKMNDKTLDISYEEKLIEFLGYSVVGPDNSNRWIILDEDNKQVGFIQYKKIYGGSKSRNKPKEYGYVTNIDGIVQYSNTRSESYKITMYSEYQLKYKDTNFNISFGEIPRLQIWNDDFGFMDFNVSDDKLYFYFKSGTENYDIEETVTVKSKNKYDGKKSYQYFLVYGDSSIDSINDYNSIDINFLYDPRFNAEGEITIEQSLDMIDKYIDRKDVVNGTVEEAIEKHKMGIDAFSHFRYIVSLILPFNEDVVGYMLQDKNIDDMFKLFVPDLVEKNKTYKLGN